MVEPFYTVFRVLHAGGSWLAFLTGPLTLGAVKGSRRHILAGRCFVLSLGTGATAGVLLATIRPDFVLDLFLLGLMTLFFLAVGYLAPRIGRGSRPVYRWDRALTVVGLLASLCLIASGLREMTLAAPVQEGVVLGGLGLWVAIAHARWRGPADPSRWRVEHLTSLLAAYTVTWSFIFSLYIQVLPMVARLLIPAVGGIAGLWWARRRFGVPTVPPAPTRRALTGAA
jgi:hypothetical protein